MTTLVTGSDGMLGLALKKIAHGEFYFSTRKDADLTKLPEVEKLFKKTEPSKVIHLAAKVGGVLSNQSFPASYFYENSQINLNVLRCAQEYKVEKLVSFISTCVFPETSTYPLNTLSLHDGPPHDSNIGYAYAKRMLDIHAKVSRLEFGSNFITLIPANMYGPGDNWKVDSGHVIPSLIRKTFESIKSQQPLIVWGSGAPLREFVFVEDIAKLTLWSLENYDSENPLILSHGIENSITELVEKICTKMDFKNEIQYDVTKPDGQFRKPSNVSLLKSLLPEFKFTSLDEGLEQTINWFIENQSNLLRY